MASINVAGDTDPVNDRRMGRAAFLTVLGLGAVGLAFGERITRGLSAPIGAVGDVIPNAVKALVPTGWRIYAVNPPWPTFHPATYRLQVMGMVARPLTLQWTDVGGLPAVDATADFHCVTGWTVGGVHWRGIRLQTLWDMAHPLPEARYVNFVSMEHPYVDTLSLEQTTMPQVMLAHTMDGAPLPREHGAPLRLVVPEMYGYKGVKWLHRIELVDRLEPGYWEQRGYDVDAWVGRSNGYF
jgi:DMSO/TMAO reductase YedYZ molybdopterin-dependent catalytic subunit